jgi:hypothetical protein
MYFRTFLIVQFNYILISICTKWLKENIANPNLLWSNNSWIMIFSTFYDKENNISQYLEIFNESFF